MPGWTIRFVRASLISLAFGAALGAVLLLQKARVLPAGGAPLLLLHVEVMLVGWFVQLTLGVAYWILPRLPDTQQRGPAWPLAWSFWLLNLGLFAIAVGLLKPALLVLVPAGRFAELMAILLVCRALLPRIRPLFASRVDST